MGLSCYCDFDPEPGTTVAYQPENYTNLNTKKRQRCMSCNTLIEVGAICSVVKRFKIPATEIELKIYTEEGEIPLADKYFCEECSDICFSLDDLGFCINPHDNMHELLEDYKDLVNFKGDNNDE